MPRKKLRASKKIWDNLPWKKISCENEDLGDFSDSMFYGLEEVDGSEYEKYLGMAKDKSASVEPVTEFDNEDSIEESVPVPKKDKEKKPKNKAKNEASVKPVAEFDDKDSIEESVPVPKKDKKKKPKKDKNDKKTLNASQTNSNAVEVPMTKVENVDTIWNSSVSLHNILVGALKELKFVSPTPIQASSIPLTLRGHCDIVGSAETGSGKTLAFGLPILHSLLHDWEKYGDMHTPYALILAPTRELAKQITSVLSDVCRMFQTIRRVTVVNVIGGMSEHKQRRQLSGSGRPVHIVVATPGRLCDLINDRSVVPFRNLSRVRYLVIDEADRMVEEGHFPELFRIFSRIREHEKIAATGKDPVEVERLAALGTDYSSDEGEGAKSNGSRKKIKTQHTEGHVDDDSKGDSDSGDVEDDLCDEVFDAFDACPTEEEIEAARRQQSAIPMTEESDTENEDETDSRRTAENTLETDIGHRQTLLFSATAMGVGVVAEEDRGGGKKRRLQQKLERSLGGEKKAAALKALGIPDHLRQLLEAVSVQDSTLVALGDRSQNDTHIDQTKPGVKPGDLQTKRKQTEGGNSKEVVSDESLDVLAIPKGLSQFEICVPGEDKDVIAYYFLLKVCAIHLVGNVINLVLMSFAQHPGRTLIFVNSIKTARRVDGLLRALEVNCRTIHSQLQQKQRIKALESFTSSPICCLVATDVAARGLDLPKVQYVLHYDVARSPQVCPHCHSIATFDFSIYNCIRCTSIAQDVLLALVSKEHPSLWSPQKILILMHRYARL